MPFDKQAEQETQAEVDLDAASAEISSDLFGGGKEDVDESEGVKPPEGEGNEADKGSAETDVSASPPQSDEGKTGAEKEQEAGSKAAEQENSEAVQAVGAPQSWSKEAIAKWATIDPEVQAYIHKREEDFHKGIEGYKTAAEMGSKMSKIIEPYAPILAAENIDPFAMLQSFAGNHYLLSRGTPEQKIQLAAQLLTGYKIPLPALLEYLADGGEGEAEDPKIAALRKEIDELKGDRKKETDAASSAAMERITQEIDAFEADEKNIYFKEVAEDMQRLFASGQASNLQEAYDKAVWSNPATRQKEIDRLTAEKQSSAEEEEKKRSDKKAAAQADKLKVGEKPRDGTVPVGSIDDTLTETLAKIESRG